MSEDTRFSANFRRLRNKYGDSQADFAKRLGVSKMSIFRYENGKFPDGTVLRRLAVDLGVNLNWLYTSEGSPFDSASTEPPHAAGGQNPVPISDGFTPLSDSINLGVLMATQCSFVVQSLNPEMSEKEALGVVARRIRVVRGEIDPSIDESGLSGIASAPIRKKETSS